MGCCGGKETPPPRAKAVPPKAAPAPAAKQAVAAASPKSTPAHAKAQSAAAVPPASPTMRGSERQLRRDMQDLPRRTSMSPKKSGSGLIQRPRNGSKSGPAGSAYNNNADRKSSVATTFAAGSPALRPGAAGPPPASDADHLHLDLPGDALTQTAGTDSENDPTMHTFVHTTDTRLVNTNTASRPPIPGRGPGAPPPRPGAPPLPPLQGGQNSFLNNTGTSVNSPLMDESHFFTNSGTEYRSQGSPLSGFDFDATAENDGVVSSETFDEAAPYYDMIDNELYDQAFRKLMELVKRRDNDKVNLVALLGVSLLYGLGGDSWARTSRIDNAAKAQAPAAENWLKQRFARRAPDQKASVSALLALCELYHCKGDRQRELEFCSKAAATGAPLGQLRLASDHLSYLRRQRDKTPNMPEEQAREIERQKRNILMKFTKLSHANTRVGARAGKYLWVSYRRGSDGFPRDLYRAQQALERAIHFEQGKNNGQELTIQLHKVKNLIQQETMGATSEADKASVGGGSPYSTFRVPNDALSIADNNWDAQSNASKVSNRSRLPKARRTPPHSPHEGPSTGRRPVAWATPPAHSGDASARRSEATGGAPPLSPLRRPSGAGPLRGESSQSLKRSLSQSSQQHGGSQVSIAVAFLNGKEVCAVKDTTRTASPMRGRGKVSSHDRDDLFDDDVTELEAPPPVSRRDSHRQMFSDTGSVSSRNDRRHMPERGRHIHEKIRRESAAAINVDLPSFSADNDAQYQCATPRRTTLPSSPMHLPTSPRRMSLK